MNFKSTSYFRSCCSPHFFSAQPWPFRDLHTSNALFVGVMKRKSNEAPNASRAKRHKEPETDYCDVIPQKDRNGNVVWPASQESVVAARIFLKEW